MASFLQGNSWGSGWDRNPGSHLFQRVASFLHSFRQIVSSGKQITVLISFREWLHSYYFVCMVANFWPLICSHLFQRVASFLLRELFSNNTAVWTVFSSLSESGFIPTLCAWAAETQQSSRGSHLFQRVASFLRNLIFLLLQRGCDCVLISFREWLHSYIAAPFFCCSLVIWFSSLSESGFIPTKSDFSSSSKGLRLRSHLFQRVASFLHCSSLFFVALL